MNKKDKQNMIFIMLNPFSIFCLIAGIVLGVLNQIPNLIIMTTQGLIEGVAFYCLGMFVSSLNIKNKRSKNEL